MINDCRWMQANSFIVIYIYFLMRDNKVRPKDYEIARLQHYQVLRSRARV